MRVFEDLTPNSNPTENFELMIGNPNETTPEKCTIGDLPVSSKNLADGAVSTDKIQNGAVTPEKLSFKLTGSTVIIAASNASQRSKDGVDFVCTGTNDELTVKAAMDYLPSGGGIIQFTEGDFNIQEYLYIEDGDSRSYWFRGAGSATRVNIYAGWFIYNRSTVTGRANASNF
ncbi:MAG: hypothetical protein LBK22_02770 [Tannerella sp.]|jgi:hypothetical protein|nr:hypothetical protein [Tannerella sp.]